MGIGVCSGIVYVHQGWGIMYSASRALREAGAGKSSEKCHLNLQNERSPSEKTGKSRPKAAVDTWRIS